LNGSINGSTTTAVNTVYHNSTGALTINGNVINTVTTSVNVIQTNSTGTLNINGFIDGRGRGDNILLASTCTVNIVGNVTRASSFSGGSAINITGASTVNITGNISVTSSGNGAPGITIANSSAILNVTGDVFHNSTGTTCQAISFTQAGRANITGSVYNLLLNSVTINTTVASYLYIVGSVYTTTTNVAINSTSATAINILTGPFISSTTGILPFFILRMHYQITMGSYFEFRDSSTNGALPPAAPAPATQLVAPSTVVDSPIPANVRDGVSYALNTLTGTLKVPAAGSVALGVPVDNTTGTAVLTPAAVWDYATSSLTTSGSIGERLKNASTVDTTGDQLAALL
jgi:hypothetical protein